MSTPTRRRRRRIALFTIAGVLLLLVAGAVWVGYRGIQAKDELTRAEPLASQIEAHIAAGERGEAVSESERLTAYANRAASLTGDPIWRIAEHTPFVGRNLTAVRLAARAVDTVALRAVAPLTRAASQLNIQSFKPKDGSVDVTALTRVRPALREATRALAAADAEFRGAPTSGTLPVVSDAVGKLRSTLAQSRNLIDSVDRAAELIPSMLGAEGPRNYLLLFANPAELRASGGISGALALVHTDDGTVSLASQVSGDVVGTFDPPIAPLPTAIESLYGQRPAQYIQDVNLGPDFTLAATLAKQMWIQRYGGSVDGVISIDPVALSYILKATGPIDLPTGQVMTSSNAVKLLLSDVYRIYPENSEEDAFFASAAAAVFSRVASGDIDPYGLIRGLVQAGTEHRIHIWSAHAEDQRLLANTSLAGRLPASTRSRAGLGLYLNDGTGAKLDYYLHVTASASSRVCVAGGQPDSWVTVTLRNGAPEDAATSLPAYVTNVARSGVPAGTVVTKVAAVGPSGSLLVSGVSGGKAVTMQPVTYEGRPMDQFTVTLAPGQSETVVIRFRDQRQRGTETSLDVTPGLHTRVVSAVAPPCTAK